MDRTQVIPTYKGPLRTFTYNYMFHAPASNNVGYSNYILYQTMRKKNYFFLQINQIGYNLLYNSKATHSIPTVIGVMSNSLLSMAASLVNGTVSIISAANLPLYKPKDKLAYNQGVFSSIILVALAFVVVPPGFAVDLVKDRQVQ